MYSQRILTPLLAALIISCSSGPNKGEDKNVDASSSPLELETSTGEIYYISPGNVLKLNEKAIKGDRGAIDQLLDYYMFSSDEEEKLKASREILKLSEMGLNLTRNRSYAKIYVIYAKKNVVGTCNKAYSYLITYRNEWKSEHDDLEKKLNNNCK